MRKLLFAVFFLSSLCGLCQAPAYVNTVTQLKSLARTVGKGVIMATNTPKGLWVYDASDNTTPENGFTVLVTTNGRRIKRVLEDGKFYVDWVTNLNDNSDDWQVTQNLLNAISSIPSGYYGERNGLTLHIKQGVLRIGKPLVIPTNAGISITGEGHTKSNIFATNGTDIIQVNGNNYRGKIEGVRLTGPQGGATGSAIKVRGSGNQINVYDCWINTTASFLDADPIADIILRGNTLEYVIDPFVLVNSYDIAIQNNLFYNCGPVSQGGQEKRASHYFDRCKRILFQGNRFINDSPMSPQTMGMIRFRQSEKISFTDNVMEMLDVSRGSTFISDSNTNIIISNNIFPKTFFHTIRSSFDKLLNISNNTFEGGNNAVSAPYTNIFVQDGNSISIIGNGGNRGFYGQYNAAFYRNRYLSIYGNTFPANTFTIPDSNIDSNYNIGEARGTLVANGTPDANKDIFIEHGLGTKPVEYGVSAGSLDARGVWSLEATSQFIIIHYKEDPVFGTQNLVFNWWARP